MSRLPTDLEVGYIGKPHGLRGDLKVRLTSDRLERVEPGASLRTDTVSLTVSTSRPHQQNHIVSFAEVTSREAAEALTGSVLYAAPLVDPDTIWIHELIGLNIVEANGTERGTVEAVQENPAADLLVTSNGALVPLTFYVDHDDMKVVVDVPDGLFSLDD